MFDIRVWINISLMFDIRVWGNISLMFDLRVWGNISLMFDIRGWGNIELFSALIYCIHVLDKLIAIKCSPVNLSLYLSICDQNCFTFLHLWLTLIINTANIIFLSRKTTKYCHAKATESFIYRTEYQSVWHVVDNMWVMVLFLVVIYIVWFQLCYRVIITGLVLFMPLCSCFIIEFWSRTRDCKIAIL